MTGQGIAVIDVLGLLLLALVAECMRRRIMLIGYGLLWSATLIGVMAFVSIPPLLELLTLAVGALFPVSALTLVAFVFIFLVLIHFSVQLTLLNERHVNLIQNLALRAEAEERDRRLQATARGDD